MALDPVFAGIPDVGIFHASATIPADLFVLFSWFPSPHSEKKHSYTNRTTAIRLIFVCYRTNSDWRIAVTIGLSDFGLRFPSL